MKVASPLRQIPGVGKSIAGDLAELDVHEVEDLVGLDPAVLYAKSCAVAGIRIDPCLLYVYRCAVYYAEGGRDPEKLKWWYWKSGS
jgi:hypothetical protein